jgi:hypothetical protein
MLVMAMTACCPHMSPTVRFNAPDHFSNLHQPSFYALCERALKWRLMDQVPHVPPTAIRRISFEKGRFPWSGFLALLLGLRGWLFLGCGHNRQSIDSFENHGRG